MANAPKTTIKQQRELVQEIHANTEVVSIRLLRAWLRNNGYEGSEDCKHYAILRTTGRCMNCTTQVTKPMILDSDEALNALREKLRSE